MALLLVGAQGRAEAAAPVVAAVGDIACNFGFKPANRSSPLMDGDGLPTTERACRQSDTARLITEAGDYRAVLALGDLLAPGVTRAEFMRSYHPTWGSFKSRTLPAVGNHEYRERGASGYFEYFNGQRGRSGRAGDPGRGWHWKRIGNWLLIALNSNCNRVDCGPRSRQVVWLKRVLRKNRKALRQNRSKRYASRCVLGYWHHPRFSSGKHGNSQPIGAFWRTLRRFDAGLVLNGHDHLYERFAPLNATGKPDRGGITQFTVGTGGRSLFRFSDEPHPQSLARVERQFGILRLRLYPRRYGWAFTSTTGKVLDHGSRRC